MQFVAHAQVERDGRQNLELLGDEEVVAPAKFMIHEVREGTGAGGGNAEQEVGIRVAGEAVGESDRAEQVRRCLPVPA